MPTPGVEDVQPSSSLGGDCSTSPVAPKNEHDEPTSGSLAAPNGDGQESFDVASVEGNKLQLLDQHVENLDEEQLRKAMLNLQDSQHGLMFVLILSKMFFSHVLGLVCNKPKRNPTLQTQ